MNSKIIILFTMLALLAVSCSRGIDRNYVKINNETVEVEIADTAEKQTTGLSNRQKINENQGMLFVFTEKKIKNFWMKNMLFNLDIIWIDGDKIVKIDKNLPKEGGRPVKIYSSALPVDYVLEVSAGWAERHKINTGDQASYFIN